MTSEPAAGGRGVPVVRSVDRALAIMEILARDGWSGVTEMARELDVHKSTVFRLLTTLERRGIVEQHTGTQKYRLGFAMVRLATGIRGGFEVTDVARKTCERLSETLDETVNIAVLEEGEAVNIEQVNLGTSIVAVDWVGFRSPLHATASGKTFLAFGPPEDAEAHLRGPLPAVTPRTVTDPDRLRVDLEEARTRGYAVTRGELEEGLHAVGAPVRDSTGAVVAAIVVSGPEYRLTEDRLPVFGSEVREGADEISHRLGWVAGVPTSPGRPAG